MRLLGVSFTHLGRIEPDQVLTLDPPLIEPGEGVVALTEWAHAHTLPPRLHDMPGLLRFLHVGNVDHVLRFPLPELIETLLRGARVDVYFHPQDNHAAASYTAGDLIERTAPAWNAQKAQTE